MSGLLHAIIPAGGAGTRLWPLSRRSHPKFLLDPTGKGSSLLQDTVERLKPLAASITVVTGEQHYDEVCAQLPQLTGPHHLPSDGGAATGAGAITGEIVVEPTPRNSMAAIGFATYIIRERYGDDAIVGSFAADHAVENPRAFREAIETAIEGAGAGYLTTVGIAPTSPSTAFGYIAAGQPPLGANLFPVDRFVEKPDPDTARRYMENGYLWNAGIFVVQAREMVTALRKYLPQMDVELTQLARAYAQSSKRGDTFVPVDRGTWNKLQNIAIDYALAEPLSTVNKVAVARAPANLGWSDIGDFQAFHELRIQAGLIDRENLAVESDDLILLRSADAPPNKMVAVLGVDNLIVVDTEDALLITTRGRSQQVNRVVDELKVLGRDDLL